MRFRLLHTADWQIGKPFGRIGGDAGTELFLQRIRTVERIAMLARERQVDAVVVAGDAFDSNEVSTRTLDRAIDALKAFDGPWVFLPGNHDPALAHSVWTRLRRMGLPRNVVIADEAEPLAPWQAAATVLPAPLRRRREAADQTAWFDAAPTPEGHLRIGLAHGGVAERLPAAAEAANEIPPERAEKAGLSYLALGDWHGVIEIAPRTWYSGTPEPDRHRDNRPGFVNLVELAGRAPPAVETIPVGHFHWASLTVAIEGGSADAAIAAVEALAENCRRCVLSLTLTGVIGLAERARLTQAITRWSDAFHVLDLDDRLRDEPTADDLDAIDRAGFVRVAVERLAAIAADPAHPEGAAARTALRMLYLDHVGTGA